jgi:hypothetical protein
MAWLSSNSLTPATLITHTHFNNLANDIRNWGGNVNAGGYNLSNLGVLGLAGFIVAPAFVGNPSAILRPTVDSTIAIRFENSLGGMAAGVDTLNSIMFADGGMSTPALTGKPNILMRPTADSATAFNIQNAAGTGSAFSVNTTTLSVVAGPGGVVSPLFSGLAKVILRPTADATDAVQIQNAAQFAIVTVDTVTGRLTCSPYIRGLIFEGNPTVNIRPLTDGAAAIKFQNVAGNSCASIDTSLSRFTTQGSIESPVYLGNPVVIRSLGDSATGIQFHNAAGATKCSISTLDGTVQAQGPLKTAVGQLWAVGSALSFLVTANSTQGYIWYNSSISVLASIDTTTGAMVIGAGTPVAGASLDLQATNKALALNRMTTAERNAIPAGDGGMIVFDRNLQKIFVTTSSGWVQVG